MNVDAYLVRCLTNMHVGVGGDNYDIISNMVQRDVTTRLPAIFSSSLKGALREFFKNKCRDDNNNDKKRLLHIFGADSDNNNSNAGIGHYNFFQADLLSLPVRAKNIPFYNATSPFLLKHINDMAFKLRKKKLFELPTDEKESSVTENGNDTHDDKNKSPITKKGNDTLEDWKAEKGLELSDVNIGENIALFNTKDFMRLASKLPVIARNKLDNGESKNLFYEEVVPRETRFVFFVAKDNKKYSKELDEIIKNYSKEFDEIIESEPIQIGANGSIGYGFCEIKKINVCSDKTK